MSMITSGVYTGQLTRLGTGTIFNGNLTKYSVIEIGEHSLMDIRASNYIENYLSDGIRSGQAVTLAIFANKIIAVRVNGKSYLEDKELNFIQKLIGGLVTLVGLLIVAGVSFGIGAVIMLIWMQIEKSKRKSILSEFNSVSA